MRNDRSFHRVIAWNKAFFAAVPALALLLTGCPADDPLPVGSVDGGGTGSGGQGTGGGGPGGDSGTGGAGGSSGTGGTAQPGNTCGGIGGLHCASASEYCEMKPGDCAIADAAGTCAPKPQVCTANEDLVCGCDGKTYSNECVAATVGVSIRATGPCSGTSDAGTSNDGSTGDSHPSGKMCGGLIGLSCAAGEYCQMAVGDCRVADAAGNCASKNVACTADVMLVCGCDGKTYSNSCAAVVAGANVASNGSCP
ncbi:MAG TPA: Kazal-type serine protease inhibitor domain-containing protein [Polyangia bacterium]|jgi:hypothetical protein|nr:Kazal-type serine protease inhibitor domain-containing protein [Polyangia bacterium]